MAENQHRYFTEYKQIHSNTNFRDYGRLPLTSSVRAIMTARSAAFKDHMGCDKLLDHTTQHTTQHTWLLKGMRGGTLIGSSHVTPMIH